MFSSLRSFRSVAVVTAVCVLSLTGCSQDDDTSSETAAEDCAYVASDQAGVKEVEAPDDSPAHEGEVRATLRTSAGDIEMVLDADAAPCTVNSFASLAEQGYFDDTTCHRIIGDFMIQCGDPSATGSGGPGYQYADELNGDETYPEGTLAMANAGPDTNGSQFFIVTGDASHLSTHTVFGSVTEESLEVIREIDASWTDGDEVPVEIETVTISS